MYTRHTYSTPGLSMSFEIIPENVLHMVGPLVLCSVSQPFKGDYVEINKNPKYQKLNSAVEEKVLLADVVNKINRANGKVRTATATHASRHSTYRSRDSFNTETLTCF